MGHARALELVRRALHGAAGLGASVADHRGAEVPRLHGSGVPRHDGGPLRYFPDAPENGYAHREANGAKVFWGRGNGWVVAGLANLLRILPKDAPNRAYYENLFKEMAGRLVALQCPDGYWRASLLDPDSYPSPETSGTGFIVYALAWGVNEGLLDRAATLPAIEKGWAALCKAVEPDGKLGYVQPIGQDPKKVTREMTEVYGVGAFLQAGAQIHRLAK